MPGSYRQVNFSLRPAKSIERKMLCEAFRRLAEFGHVSDYRYIGFGSTYFSDFILVHKTLAIRQMLSIEKDAHNQERFEFNRPFNSIEIAFGESNEILPKLTWRDIRTICWLDYDGTLDGSVLADVRFFCSNAVSGSALVVTVNAEPDRQPDESTLRDLKERVGEDSFPLGLTLKDLSGWGTAGTYRRILENTIRQTLSERNGALPEGSRLHYEQLFNFNYRDGARMLTMGGLLYDRGQAGKVNGAFEGLSFIRANSEPYLIDIPSLTYREMRYLDSHLPNGTYGDLDFQFIPESDFRKYSQTYRYFPTYAETEM